MKLWGTVRKNNEIIRQHTIEYAGLKKHLKELEDFSRVVFRADDFMEPVDFDKFEIEIFYPKKK